MFCEKGVLRNFAKFSGKHLCQSLFFDKAAGGANNKDFASVPSKVSHNVTVLKKFWKLSGLKENKISLREHFVTVDFLGVQWNTSPKQSSYFSERLCTSGRSVSRTLQNVQDGFFGGETSQRLSVVNYICKILDVWQCSEYASKRFWI